MGLIYLTCGGGDGGGGAGGGGNGGVNDSVNVKISVLSLLNPHSIKTCRGAELWLHAFFTSTLYGYGFRWLYPGHPLIKRVGGSHR